MAGVLDKFKLTGKVAWITGASYGLGLAYAEAYAEAGAKVVFNDINQELVDRGLAEYKKLGIKVYGAVCDVTNEKQVEKFVSDVEKKVGPIDILVNNAGIIKRIPMTEMTLNEWNAVINVDLTGPFICSKAVIPSMIKRGGGKIINACSMMSELGRETVSAYAAAKGGLKHWLQPMAWSMSLTCLTFIYLAFTQDQNLLTINICVFIEQFGYGFGFTAYMLYLIYYSEGPYKTAHYAICTGFMALSMMMGMMAGWLEDLVGYQNFFIWTMICCACTIIVAMIVKVDPKFGLKEKDETPKTNEESK